FAAGRRHRWRHGGTMAHAGGGLCELLRPGWSPFRRRQRRTADGAPGAGRCTAGGLLRRWRNRAPPPVRLHRCADGVRGVGLRRRQGDPGAVYRARWRRKHIMSNALRLSEKWFRRGLWLVAFLFAWFLTGLGSTIVGDLPKVEQQRSLNDFMDASRAPALRQTIQDAGQADDEARAALDQAQLKLQVARADNQAARETFSNWLATRRATAQGEHDDELVRRTRELDALRQVEREAQTAVQQQQQAGLDARQRLERAQAELGQLERQAREAYERARRAQELRVFGYRLALTLPLLLVAGWLFKRHRKGAS